MRFVAQKREVESRALSFQFEVKRGAGCTVACRPALEPLKAERESRLQIPGMDDTRVGAPIEKKRNTILVRSEEL